MRNAGERNGPPPFEGPFDRPMIQPFDGSDTMVALQANRIAGHRVQPRPDTRKLSAGCLITTSQCDDVRTPQRLNRLTQQTPGQHMIEAERARCVEQNDVDRPA